MATSTTTSVHTASTSSNGDGDHPSRSAWLTIGLGAFADGDDSSERNSFCMEWRTEGMRLAEKPARDRPELLGAFLPRDVALNVPNLDHLWHIADHVVTDDPRVARVESWLRDA